MTRLGPWSTSVPKKSLVQTSTAGGLTSSTGPKAPARLPVRATIRPSDGVARQTQATVRVASGPGETASDGCSTEPVSSSVVGPANALRLAPAAVNDRYTTWPPAAQ